MFEKILEKLNNEDYTFQGGEKDLKKDLSKFDVKDLTRCFLDELRKVFRAKIDKVSEKWGSPWDHSNKHKKRSERERVLLRESYDLSREESRRIINEIRNDKGVVSEFEKTFLESHGEVLEKIQERVREAERLLGEAETISERWGVPFYSSISGLGQHYTPASLKELGSDAEWVLYEFDIPADTFYGGEMYGGGWQHSAICY